MVIISLATGNPQTYEVISKDGSLSIGGKMVDWGYTEVKPVGEGPYTIKFFNGAPWALDSSISGLKADAWILYTGVEGSTTLESGPTFPLKSNPQ